MLIALNQENILIYAKDCIVSSVETTKYVCPSCKQDLILKKGTTKIAHFAHKIRAECASFSEGETDEHLLGKQLLFEMFKENKGKVFLEAYLSDLKQRPDILWETDEGRIAIEFQCSTLNIKRMKERTLNYKKKGYKIIWILGKNLHIKDKLTNLQKTFIGSTKHGNFYYLEFDVYKKVFTIIYNLHAINHSRKINYKIQSYSIKNCDKIINCIKNSEDVNFEINKYSRYYISIRENYARSSAYYSSSSMKLCLKKIYQNRDSLVSIPIECYVTLPCDWMISSSNILWKYYVLKFIQSKTNNLFTQKELENLLERLIENELLIFCDFPLFSSSFQGTPLKEFCDFLVKQNILKNQGGRIWKINKKPTFFGNETDKRKQIYKEPLNEIKL